MKLKKMLLLSTLVLSCLLIFSACTKNETNSLERVKSAGKLTVVGSGGYPPFNFMEEGKVVGFDVDAG